MIEEQFVSLDTARMLKEAGFNVPCRYSYDNVGGFRWSKIGESTPKGWVPCPTQALAARWLREVHRISVDAEFMAPSTNIDVWKYFIGKMDDMIWPGDFETSERTYAIYEEAMEAGLREAVKLIKK
ncbi:MAG: hypothetical protein H9791_03345 [Candidatus Bacteroides intestinipullorum]|uniref:Uncharacterized protein n=1 Tax=Candidatus Bacteroides intestinipullorum TaxID=2838471 RepID=A0A9E2NN20_9BACE|nr:hypothetical protein [Candidatus Bacteroides intestinipullorum]